MVKKINIKIAQSDGEKINTKRAQSDRKKSILKEFNLTV
jgi:hypothetical protein